MSRVGFEPTANGLKAHCSTAELPARSMRAPHWIIGRAGPNDKDEFLEYFSRHSAERWAVSRMEATAEVGSLQETGWPRAALRLERAPALRHLNYPQSDASRSLKARIAPRMSRKLMLATTRISSATPMVWLRTLTRSALGSDTLAGSAAWRKTCRIASTP